MLCHQAELDHVQTVILDEVHFLGDKERGSIWETVIILLPAHITLLCLSASVPNCLDLAGWICQTRHCACHMLLKRSRPTPLRTYGIGDKTSLLAADEVFWEEHLKQMKPAKDPDMVFQAIAANDSMSPALVFMFSKAHCQAYAQALKHRMSQADLVARLICEFLPKMSEAVKFWCERKICRLCPTSLREVEPEVLRLAEETLQHLPEEDRSLGQVEMIMDLVRHGLAVHHAGLLAPLRELVERLCARGLVRILFCTETCAVGLNLPAKSVAFAFGEKGLRKFEGAAWRCLRAAEYHQMAGRAGRRGRDKHGNVLWCMISPDPRKAKKVVEAMCKQFPKLAQSLPEPLESSYVLRFSFVLSLLKFGHMGYIKWLALQTFSQFQSRQAALSLEQYRIQKGMLSILEA